MGGFAVKRIRNATALLVIFRLLLSVWTPAAVIAAPAARQEETLYFGRSVLAQMPNGDALCYAYDRMVEGCAAMADSIDVTHHSNTLSAEEAFLVYDAVMDDHPAFFWLTEGVQAGSYNNAVTTLCLFPPKNATETLAAVEARVTELTAGLGGKSDYEKSRILHDRLCETVTYTSDKDDQSVIGSLLKGTAVCAGYVRGYQLLLQRVGIPSFCVTGFSKDQAHAWNLVQLDGEWYYTDVTWDDQNDNGGLIYYTYLNNTYAQISETHIPDVFTEYLPRATATAANFYVRNGLVIDAAEPLDIAKLAQGLSATYPPQFYCTGDSVESIYQIFAQLDELVSKAMGKKVAYRCDGAGLLDNGIAIYLNIDHDHHYATGIRPASCTLAGRTAYRCTDCGHTTVETAAAVGHNKVWGQDDTHHTLCCDRCGLAEDSGEHAYRDDADTDCNVCGYTRTVSAALPGDADGNGKLNNRDLGLLQQYLNEWDVVVDVDAADINDDGRINNRDLGLLQRMLNE